MSVLPGSFSDYIVYVDESGDHSLAKFDPEFPVFVLTFCIFRKEDYIGEIVPALQRIKFKHFGHDMTARPVGRHVMNPGQVNRAYSIIEKKLDRSKSGKIEGYGLKTYP